MRIQRNPTLERCIDASIFISAVLLVLLAAILLIRYTQRRRVLDAVSEPIATGEAQTDPPEDRDGLYM